MKTICFWALLIMCPTLFVQAQETFSSKRIVNANTPSGRFRHPFAMVLGPDDSLWVTERRGYVIRVNRINGGKTELLNISHKVKFSTSGTTGIKQDGMLGIIFHPAQVYYFHHAQRLIPADYDARYCTHVSDQHH